MNTNIDKEINYCNLLNYCVHTYELNVIMNTIIRNSVGSGVWYHVRDDVQADVVESLWRSVENSIASAIYNYEY